jgi:hypothetical protein
MGRPSLPPGRYFRLLLVGYFEGLDSERGMAMACGGFARGADPSWAATSTPQRPTTRRFRARGG